MALVSFQVIEGLEAGQQYVDLETPVTIGREEDNDVRLNDERVSRFHAKIQDDQGRVILTDLGSTNGTRVNGRSIHFRVLRLGDQITIGRCVLVFGSPQQLGTMELQAGTSSSAELEVDQTFAAQDASIAMEFPEAFPNGPPPLPAGLSPLHTAEVSDVIEYMRYEILYALHRISEVNEDKGEAVVLPPHAWRRLQAISVTLAKYAEKMANPDQ